MSPQTLTRSKPENQPLPRLPNRADLERLHTLRLAAWRRHPGELVLVQFDPSWKGYWLHFPALTIYQRHTKIFMGDFNQALIFLRSRAP